MAYFRRLTDVENEIAAVKNNQTSMQNTLNDILAELRHSNHRTAQQPSEGKALDRAIATSKNGVLGHASSTSSPPPGAGTPFEYEYSAALTVYPAQNPHNIPGTRSNPTSGTLVFAVTAKSG
jgi:hypothetical protein